MRWRLRDINRQTKTDKQIRIYRKRNRQSQEERKEREEREREKKC